MKPKEPFRKTKIHISKFLYLRTTLLVFNRHFLRIGERADNLRIVQLFDIRYTMLYLIAAWFSFTILLLGEILIEQWDPFDEKTSYKPLLVMGKRLTHHLGFLVLLLVCGFQLRSMGQTLEGTIVFCKFQCLEVHA